MPIGLHWLTIEKSQNMTIEICCITTLNALIVYSDTFDYNFDLINASLIRKEKDLQRRKCIESVPISQFLTINLRLGLYIISLIITKAMATESSI